MRLLTIFAGTIVFLSCFASAATWYVPDNFPTIQDAIKAATGGDVIIVRPGTYKERIDFLGKPIQVRSEKGYAVTVIDGSPGAGVVRFENGENSSSVLDGFTVTGGYATNDKAGIVCLYSSPTIINNHITGNFSGYHGGGVNCEMASPTIRYNLFTNNGAGASGIGSGGAIGLSYSNPYISGNVFIGNTADYGGGGAIHVEKQAAPVIENNIFAYNSAEKGGALNLFDGTPKVTGNTITYNKAAVEGGAICNGDWAKSTVVNTIVWDNKAGVSGMEIAASPGGSLTVEYCDVKGGWPGTGNIDADPLYADAAARDFHLKWGSPCIDAGDGTATSEPLDFEGDPRLSGGDVDMGADEFYRHLYHVGDAVPGATIDIKVIGPPGATPVRLALGSGIQDPPQQTPYGDLYLVLPPLFSAGIGTIPADGLLVYQAKLPGFWSPGSQKPLQALVGPLGNPASRLTNLLMLTVE
jgi:hypothetical protein